MHAIKLTAREPASGNMERDGSQGREGMMYAQYIAAQAFNSGGLGIIHSTSHAISAFYDTHHGLNNAIALPRVWAFNMPAHYKRFADIAEAMGVDTYGMTDVQAAEAALAAGIRLLRDVGIPERFVDVKKDSYSKNRLGQGPTEYYKNSPVIKGDKADVDRITNHVLGDACTPGNAKECTFDTVRPVIEHCMTGDLDDLLKLDRRGGAPPSGFRRHLEPRS